MHYLLAIETFALEQLRDLAQPGLVVRAQPERPTLAGERFDVGELTVHVDDQDGDKITSPAGGSRQDVTVYLDLFLRIDRMTVEGGYYELMAAIASRLFGHQPPLATSPLVFVSSRFSDQVEGWYMYTIRWACSARLFKAEETLPVPTIKRIGFLGNTQGDHNELFSKDPDTGQQLTEIEFRESP